MEYKIRRSRTVDPRLMRDEMEAWQPGGRSVTYVPLKPGKFQTAAGTQTDTAPDFLPSLPNEKATMTSYHDDGRNSALYQSYPTYRPGSGNDDNQSHNNYYQRMSMSMDRPHGNQDCYNEPGPPTYRSGNMGGSWRHVQRCINNMGNHLCFVDGTVKQDDMKKYPPFGYVHPSESYSYVSPRLKSAPMRRSMPNAPPSQMGDGPPMSPMQIRRLHGKAGHSKRDTKYNMHARNGFKYWYDEKPPGVSSCLVWHDIAPKHTIFSKQMVKYAA